MLGTKNHPYFIIAPDYKESSSGIQVMHRLCHLINECGGTAYITGCSEINPNWNTPLLSEEVYEQHVNNCIGVYPDVVSGNPLSAPVCVRYMLNREGVINGNPILENSDDLFFFYRGEFADQEVGHDLLTLPVIDLNLFCDEGYVRDMTLLNLNRIPLSCIDFSLLPKDIHILSSANPVPLSELAEILKRGKVLYSFEASGTCALAALCGCPVVAKVVAGYEHFAMSEKTLADMGNAGISWHDDEESLTKVSSELYKVRDFVKNIELDFQKEFCVFLEKTQNYASQKLSNKVGDVRDWLENKKPPMSELNKIQENYGNDVGYPHFHIFIIDVIGDGEAITKTLESIVVARNKYPNIEITVISPVSFSLAVTPNWIKTVCADDVVSEINSVTNATDVDWIQMVSAGCLFNEYGMVKLGLSLCNDNESVAVYCDELIFDEQGNWGGAFLPEINLELLLSVPEYFAKRWLYRREIFLGLGGLDNNLAYAYELDLIVRIVCEKGTEAIKHVPDPLLSAAIPVLESSTEIMSVLERYLQLSGYSDSQVHSPLPGCYRLIYNHPSNPLVSILIVANEQLVALQKCITSILEKTRYSHYELIILDNNNTDKQMSNWLEGLKVIDAEKIRVIRSDTTLNYPSANNRAVSEAKGEYLQLLDVHTLIIQENWLDNLLNQALRSDIGMVGPKIISREGRVLSAGYILGLNGLADSPFTHERYDAVGYMQRLQVEQRVSALPMQCLLIRKSIYTQLSGCDVHIIDPQINSVEMSLRLTDIGYRAILTPHATVVLDNYDSLNVEKNTENPQSETAIIIKENKNTLYQKWWPIIACDPQHNINLSMFGGGFNIEWNSGLTYQSVYDSSQPVIMALYPYKKNSYEDRHSRVETSYVELVSAGAISGLMVETLPSLVELLRYRPDTLSVALPFKVESSDSIRKLRDIAKTFILADADALAMYCTSASSLQNLPIEIINNISVADRLVVTSPLLCEILKTVHPDVVSVNSYLPTSWQYLVQIETEHSKPRIGCIALDLIPEDIDILLGVMENTFLDVDWVFYGAYPKILKPYIREFHRRVPKEQYAEKLLSLRLDLAVVPRADLFRNRCGNNMRILEHGACGVPVICSDIVSHRCNLPITLVKNKKNAWIESIRSHCENKINCRTKGSQLQHKIQSEWILTGSNLEQWLNIYLPYA